MGQAARRTIETRRYYWVENARRALAAVGLEPGPAATEALPVTDPAPTH
jgi:hypothetical protein